MVFGLVVAQVIRGVALVSEADFVQEIDTALPVAGENLSGGRTVVIVLPTHEIPHKVAAVHPAQLVVEEEIQVLQEGGLGVFGTLYFDAAAVHIRLVEADVFRVAAAPHTREQHFPLGFIFHFARAFRVHIFPIEGSPILVFPDVVRRIEILSVEQRGAAILFAGQVAHQRERIVRLVLVGGRLDGRTDDADGENGKADDDGRQAKQRRVPENTFVVARSDDTPVARSEQG